MEGGRAGGGSWSRAARGSRARTLAGSSFRGLSSPKQQKRQQLYRSAFAGLGFFPSPLSPAAAGQILGFKSAPGFSNLRGEAAASREPYRTPPGLRGRSAPGGPWFRECAAHFPRWAFSEDGGFACLPGLRPCIAAPESPSASGSSFEVRGLPLLPAGRSQGSAARGHAASQPFSRFAEERLCPIWGVCVCGGKGLFLHLCGSLCSGSAGCLCLCDWACICEKASSKLTRCLYRVSVQVEMERILILVT